MSLRPIVAISTIVLCAACAAPPAEPGADSAWVGTITTEGDITTVVNESGSVWEGTATLIEEASIGVDVGQPEYMLGSIAGTWATNDRIYVADLSTPVVRVFDFEGNHLFNLGRQGQGPGEFQRPDKVVASPDGLLYVRDLVRGTPITVFTADGEYVETLRADPMVSSAWPMVYTHDGELYTPVRGNPQAEPGERISGMGIPSRDGVVGDPLAVPTLDFESPFVAVLRTMRFPVPFAPDHTWAMSPSGAIVVGVSDAYHFEIHHRSGHITRVERVWEGEPIDREEREWERRSIIFEARRFNETFNWDGAEIAERKRSYSTLYVDAGGRIWVNRRGPTRPIEDCDPDPLDVTDGIPRRCWEYDLLLDVFDEEGRLLSSGIKTPEGFRHLYSSYIRGDTFIAPVEDEAGTVMVKRYRIAPPGDEGP